MSEEKKSSPKLFRSGFSGEGLTLRRARLAIVAPEELPRRPHFRGMVSRADPGNPDDRTAIEAINRFFWGEMEQDVFGRTYKILDCENFLARPTHDKSPDADESEHGIAGHVALTPEDEGFLHIVVFHVWPSWQGRGVGRSLVDASITEARKMGFSCIKLGTTNDNLPALYFYQRAGFVIEKVIPGEVASHHGIEPPGFAGIRVRDEIQLRLNL